MDAFTKDSYISTDSSTGLTNMGIRDVSNRFNYTFNPGTFNGVCDCNCTADDTIKMVNTGMGALQLLK